MSEITDYEVAKSIMDDNFIGVDELKKISQMRLSIPDVVGDIPFSQKELQEKRNDYILILGIGKFDNGKQVTIRNIKEIFRQDPDVSEPCFYNQDWYDKEDFINIPMIEGWYLIRKKVYRESRAIQPEELLKKYLFPSAISCVYAFFTAWYALNIKLWYHDFVWCRDMDHNGDRIYVGKYHDVDGVNKNGFSIHRYLGLRNCYGCID